MILIGEQSLTQTNRALVTEKQQQMQYLVETVHSLVESHYKDFTTGNRTEEQAKLEAIKAIKQVRYDTDNYFWINDENATVIMHPIKQSLNGKNLSSLQDANGKYIFTAFIKTAKAQSTGGVVDYLWPKPGSEVAIDKISFVKEFKPWGWIIGSGVYINDIQDSLWSAMRQLLTYVIIITTFILILSFFTVRSIISPIQKTTSPLTNLANGDLTQRLPINGQDEIAKLSQSFNEFIAKVQGIVKDVQHSSEVVNHSSSDLSSLSEKALQSSKQQNLETTQIATASNEMLNMSTEIASNATTAANLTKNANTEVQTSKTIVDESVRSVHHLSTEISGASSVISKLENRCQSIDSVLSVIQAIAEQTNLLALNAAIEAARAGEQGRGFAVVADEVRTLAGRTQVATLEINNIIAQLQDEANQAVVAISASENIAENTVEQSNKASLSLGTIADSITAISDTNQHIATEAEEQSNITRGIDERVIAIADLSEQSTDYSINIHNASEELSHLGTQLRELIKKFKV